MKRLLARSTSPRLQVWVAGLSLLAWLLVSPIAMVTGLKSALWWITFMSLFANVATCFGWWVSSLVNVKAERIDDRSEETARIGHIDELEQRILDVLCPIADRLHRMDTQHGDQLAQILDATLNPPEPPAAEDAATPTG